MATYSEQLVITANASQAEAALQGMSRTVAASAATWESKLAAAGKRLTALGTGMQRFGRTARTYLTLPLVAAGAIATKMALDFNQAFVRIQTLGGETGQSMESLKAQVLDLAEATGQDPGGLANALYIVSSAGKEAAQNAIPILTQAAKGAALGMGDVNQIAKVLTATTNAYGSETLSAAQAMDILSQAVTDSSAEADELAEALGPVIGIAAQVGISFQEVAAALATATVQGVATDRAATGLRFLMQSLAAPTQEASTWLDRYGFSAQDLQRLIDREGLQGSLQTLADAFDLTSVRGQQAWSAVIGGARGAIVANTLVGKHAAEAAAEVENLGNVAGVTEEKFKLWGQTITGENAKAFGALKKAAITLGTDLIPVFQKIVEVVSGVVDAFNDLSPAAQDNVVKFGLFAAALPVVVSLLGTLIKVGGGALTILSKLGPAAATAFGVGAGAGAGAASAAAAATKGAEAMKLFVANSRGVVVAEKTIEVAGTTATTATTKFGAALKALGTISSAVLLADIGESWLIDFNVNVEELREGLATLDPQVLTTVSAMQRLNELFVNQPFEAPLAEWVEENRSGLRDIQDVLPELDSAMLHILALPQDLRAGVAAGEIAQLTQALRAGLISFEDYAAMLEQITEDYALGARGAGTFEEQVVRTTGAFAESLLTAKGLTREESSAIVELAGALHKAGIQFDPVLRAMVDAEIAAGRGRRALLLLGAAARGPLSRAFEGLSKDMSRSARSEFEAALAHHNYRRAAELLIPAQRKVNRGLAEQADRAGKSRLELQRLAQAEHRAEAGMDALSRALLRSNKLTPSQVEHVRKLQGELRKVGGSLSNTEAKMAGAAVKAGDLEGAVQILVKAIIRADKAKADPKIDAETNPALTKIAAVQQRLQDLNGDQATVFINAVVRQQGAGGILGAGGVFPGLAHGGIRGAANGMIVNAPVLVGEGTYSTPFGKGGEAILPLTDQVLGRLGKTIVMALEGTGAGGRGGGPTIVFNVHGVDDPVWFARRASEELAKRAHMRTGS